MKYGIVACPKCKKVKGVHLAFKTTKCIGCGKILNLQKIKILYSTNNEVQLRYEIGKINAKKDGLLEEFVFLNQKR